MAFATGERATAFRVNNLAPVPYSATGTGTLTLSTTFANIDDAYVEIETVTDNAAYIAIGTFAFDITSATTDYAEGIFLIDGVQQGAKARWSGEVGTDYDTVAQTWYGTVATAGTYIYKLQANRSTTGGTIQVLNTYSKITVIIFEVV